MFTTIISSIKRFVNNIKNRIKQWSKPTTIKLAAEALSDLKRSRKDLIAENAILRQQLIVLNRQVKRPQLNQGDRLGLVILARLTGFWQQALHIVQPALSCTGIATYSVATGAGNLSPSRESHASLLKLSH